MDNVYARAPQQTRTISITDDPRVDNGADISFFDAGDDNMEEDVRDRNDIADFEMLANIPEQRPSQKEQLPPVEIRGENYFGGNNADSSSSDDDDDDDDDDSDNDSNNSPPQQQQQNNIPRYGFPTSGINDDTASVGSSRASSTKRPKQSYEDIQKEKQKLLFELERFRRRGIKPSRAFTMASELDDIKFEYQRLKHDRDVENSIKFQRKVLLAFVGGTEYLNEKFDPIGARLDGWSENVMEDIDTYDEVFEELHDKYAEKIKMAPELKLLMMVGGSAFMFHMTQSLFKSGMPNMNDILRNNPDLAQNLARATMGSMGADPNDPAVRMMQQGVNMTTGAAAAARRKTAAPVPSSSDVDDIINELSGVSAPSPAPVARRGAPPPAVETRTTKTGQPIGAGLPGLGPSAGAAPAPAPVQSQPTKRRQPKQTGEPGEQAPKKKRRQAEDSTLNLDF